ncbi:MAG: EscU/YscU/HrcU family type III secretion system export apparatus switch protein [Thermoflavifilum sp.]|nr:EscU/YscU/HrcU family type III secretion system export apparatus switch protein [Thermoflavifilum sp.]MCL6513363.1 EscU/YscU/HrcU family type III secretion system export apparatus switch protein [Alicyclobacillus sp.]
MVTEKRLKAVALRYEAQRDAAPRVVAKGAGVVAEALVRAAADAGVPIERQPQLADALAALEIDQLIPPELYRAVAEVLAIVYRTAGTGADGQNR